MVWCKLSRKKHKNWEGDAVLIVKGRSVVLKVGQRCYCQNYHVITTDEEIVVTFKSKEFKPACILMYQLLLNCPHDHLQNMEGKEIGRGMGYRLKDLSSLEEGSTLPVGGKEVEVSAFS